MVSVLSMRFAQIPGRLLLDAITADDLRGYVTDLRERNVRWANHRYRESASGGLSSLTIAGFVRSIKRFFNWLEQNGYLTIDQNPAVLLKKPKLPLPLPIEITIDDIRNLLGAAKASKTFPERDYAIVLFLADTGCRVGGLVGLRLAELDLINSQALVTEKGRKPRYVFFSDATKSALQKWLTVRPQEPDFVFVGTHGQLTIWGVGQGLPRLKRKAGIEGRVNPHSFRHSSAKRYLNNGGDLATLADMLGHTDVLVTKRFYSVFTTEELRRKHELHNPLADIIGDSHLQLVSGSKKLHDKIKNPRK